MTRMSNRIETAKQQPTGKANPDAYHIDEEFDDFLDRELFALRETLADFRNF
jgi:hypothetical protein